MTTRHTKLFAALAILGALVFSLDAQAVVGTVSTPNSVLLGTVTAPASLNYNDSFVAPTAQQFYDDYTFVLSPAASFSSVTASINLGAFLGIDNISARLYQGSGRFGGASTPLIQSWSTPFSAGPGLTGSFTVIAQPALAANTYTLEIRGDVVGTAGGSYAGILNVSPIPEPTEPGMLLLGLGLLGCVVRKGQKQS